jgi:peptidyl-prolyl cis-trans isomerase C
MTRLAGTLSVLSLAVALASCSKEASPGARNDALGPGDVATVNGERIPESVFRVHALGTMRKNADELTPEERKAVLNDLVGVVVMAGEAEKQGLLTERTIAAQLELARLQLIARALATRYLEKNAATESEIQALYEQNLPRLSAQQFKARNIIVETKEEADAVIGQLKQGKDFVALANERASGPTGPNGGELGWFTAESMNPTLVEAVRAMEVGTYSAEPVQTDFGYHVLLLEDTQTQVPTIESLRQDLVSAVERNKLQAYVGTLMEGATVVEN